jgi:hypothetical protein
MATVRNESGIYLRLELPMLVSEKVYYSRVRGSSPNVAINFKKKN